MRKMILLAAGTTLLLSKPIPHSLSFQGYTGLINTPNAQVMDEGDISLSFNNQFDNHLRNYNYDLPEKYAEDYLFGVGLLPNLEIQGRFKEQPGYARDLSANIKYKLPQWYEYLPNIAIGAEDLGSAANLYENYYIVADKQFWFLRASLGYGYSNVKKGRSERMDGLFGGVEAQVVPWLSLLGEYDGEETHAGARFFMPQSWSDKVKLHCTVASNLTNDGEVSVMFSAIFPLAKHDRYKAEPLGKVSSAATVESGTAGKTASSVKRAKSYTLQDLVDALSRDGLQNVTVGTKEDMLYIAYENSVYLHNELDAIAAVLREAVKLAGSYERFVIEPKHSNVVVATLSGSLLRAADYYDDPSYARKQAFIATLEEGKNGVRGWQIYTKDANNGRFRPKIVLTPKLTTFVGTDIGAFDYQLMLGAIGYVNLYEGLDLTFHYDAKISNSDNLDPVYGIFGYAYSDGGWYSAMLNYSNRVGEGLNTLSAGLFEYDYLGVMDQFIYHTGNHTFKLKAGYFEHQDYEDDREVFLAKYSYHFTPMDIFAEVEGGKYWGDRYHGQDTGFGISFKRYFGDVAVVVSYLQTSPEENVPFSDDPNQYMGIGIEIPLDFAKSKLSGKYGQINGDTAWRYTQRTTVSRDDGTNIIVPFRSGYNPAMDIDSETYFYNRNRMSIDYIKENAERILK